jgi:hypothetical protein
MHAVGDGGEVAGEQQLHVDPAFGRPSSFWGFRATGQAQAVPIYWSGTKGRSVIGNNEMYSFLLSVSAYFYLL